MLPITAALYDNITVNQIEMLTIDPILSQNISQLSEVIIKMTILPSPDPCLLTDTELTEQNYFNLNLQPAAKLTEVFYKINKK